jgi:hypothetical protein
MNIPVRLTESTHNPAPFRHWVFDDAFKGWSNEHTPGRGEPGWEACYDNPHERNKRTTRHLLMVPGAISLYQALTEPNSIFEFSNRLGFAVIPDPILWGGGVQVMEPGGSLACHIDADRHPRLKGWKRAATLIAYLGDRSTWRGTESTGGELQLCSTNGDLEISLAPIPGRLVFFENSDTSYHSVSYVREQRVSLAIPFLSKASGHNVRTRSLFIPVRG